MSLKLRITDDMKTAMRAKDSARLGTIRLLLAAMKQREVDERIELSDADIIAIVDKMLKQRRDSIAAYEAAGRHELAAQEKFEMTVLSEYLPQAASDAEIEALLDAAIQVHGVAVAAMGKIMAELKPKLAGRADMAEVSRRLKSRLS